MSTPEIFVERLEAYTEADAADLGKLRNALSSDRSSVPLSERRVRQLIDRPDRVIVAARDAETGHIVGGETIVTIPVLEGEDDDPEGIGWLGFVSTLPEYRGHGIVKRVTLEGLNWCVEQGLEELKFTSNSHNPEREGARAFYIKFGARIVAAGVDKDKKDTDLFSWKVQDGLSALG